MGLFGTADILAVSFFVLSWAVYAITLERSSHGRNSLSARMSIYREVWIRRILDREARMDAKGEGGALGALLAALFSAGDFACRHVWRLALSRGWPPKGHPRQSVH